ncbi:hypothetical protein AAVH_32377 [Aphelenchoides avenae]|nr:hypothetical protein AAVH_32377 [Aphelenchus avenae]
MIKGKQATRGQKQIYEENQSTFRAYSAASFGTAVVWAALNWLLFEATTTAWVGWGIAVALQLAAILLMKCMMKSVRNDKNQITDAGMDLNDPAAFGEYCKDAIILCCAAQVLSLVSGWFYLILLGLPAFAGYKFWVSFLGPWIFAPAPEPEEQGNEKSQRRREKIKYLRR